ncbi:hypothetical protein CCACVL1_16372 [Corchorus capsularis]|uniref:Uncharacterized protein n=1 Tax=Corchorus capsularis TaxID=210143 RepID=A0A1R3HXB9_COCAP|nr:hypothetical protein CCACVL1_16372 [Corchorus capsularis]
MAKAKPKASSHSQFFILILTNLPP